MATFEQRVRDAVAWLWGHIKVNRNAIFGEGQATNLGRLTTAAKASLVDAINEVNATGGAGNGGPGGFQHDQTTPATTWVVNHDLGYKPVVGIFSPGGMEVEADVEHVSPYQARVHFVSPQAGFARCV